MSSSHDPLEPKNQTPASPSPQNDSAKQSFLKSLLLKRPTLRSLIAPLVEPYARYQYGSILHAVRLGVAVVATLVINAVTGLPHGEWSSITVFIILGLLQYQGAIYTKARERIIGTVMGIVVGIVLVWLYLHGLNQLPFIYYGLIGVISGIIGYYAVKNLGYIGLLTGITMCMIVAEQGNIGQDGVLRALNVLLGTLIAVLATLILPLKSTLMWRFLLANNLDACSRMYAGIGEHVDAENGECMDSTNDKNDDTEVLVASGSTEKEAEIQHPTQDQKHGERQIEQLQTGHSYDAAREVTTTMDPALTQELREINKRLLAVRPHIAATAKELGIEQEALETIQHIHRNIIGTIDLLLNAASKLALIPLDEDNRILLTHYKHELTQAMQHMAAVLRSPNDEVFRPITRIKVSHYPSVHALPFEWQGYFWLTQTLQTQLQQMSDLLQDTKQQWYAASGIRYQRREQRRIEEHGSEKELDI